MTDLLPVANLLDEKELARASWFISEWTNRLPWYQTYRNYYNGNHNILSVNEGYSAWFALLLKRLKLNLCGSVIDALVDRLEIMSWEPNEDQAREQGQNPGPEDSRDRLVKIAWQHSRGPHIMNEVHEGASIEGDSYVMVWPDRNNELRMWPHRGDEMMVWYDPELPDSPSAGLKIWSVQQGQKYFWRLNMYWPGKVVRLMLDSGDDSPPTPDVTLWKPVEDEFGPEVSNSLGQVPIVHFTPGRQCNERGPSDLKHAIPIQDGLNKSVIDLVVSGEGMALPLRVLTGVAVMPDPETGKTGGPQYNPREDIWMNIANEQARLWQAQGADVEKLIKVVDHFIVNMARVTHTPPERLLAQLGGVQSGVSRKVAEGPLVGKVMTRRQRYTPSWVGAFEMIGPQALPIWGPATMETEEERWQIGLVKSQMGIPLPQILSEMGYTESQIQDMYKRAEKMPQGFKEMIGAATQKVAGVNGAGPPASAQPRGGS